MANVSLAYGIDPPAQLSAVEKGRVGGLTVNPRQLALIRSNREQEWRMSGSPYGESENVAREVAWARRLFAQREWPEIDVTDRAAEETAVRILELVQPRHRSDGGE